MARQYSEDYLFNHVMRTWLFGALVISHNTTLQHTVDLEVHAIGAMLHVSDSRAFQIFGYSPQQSFIVNISSGGGIYLFRLFQDLGLALNASFISSNLRFEVDGASAATNFVEDQVAQNHGGSAWDAHRLQLLWDSVALSAEFGIALYKQPTVAAVAYGVGIDLTGPDKGVTSAEYENVLTAFPKLNFISGVNQTLIALCVQKPNSTYG
jgi:hypothetical protein